MEVQDKKGKGEGGDDSETTPRMVTHGGGGLPSRGKVTLQFQWLPVQDRKNAAASRTKTSAWKDNVPLEEREAWEKRESQKVQGTREGHRRSKRVFIQRARRRRVRNGAIPNRATHEIQKGKHISLRDQPPKSIASY